MILNSDAEVPAIDPDADLTVAPVWAISQPRVKATGQ